MRLTTDLFAYCKERIPKWNTVSISGYHFREKGARAVQEVAFTLASGMAYVQAALDAGLKVDDFAPRLAFFFNGHNNVFQEVAKFRAARNMWAHAMRDRFGAQDPKSLMLRFHTQTGGVTLTAQQPMNNIVRVALQGFAAVCGGTQSLHTNGYDEALALPSERAAKLALRTQQVIAYESGATDTVDPFAGSYYVESLTAEIEQRAWALIEKVDEQGGSVNAIAFIKNEIEESAFGYHERYRAQAGHRGRRQRVRRGLRRGRGDPVRRPRVRARPARAPEGVQGRARPGADRPARSRSSSAAAEGADNLLPADPRRAQGQGLASARSAARCATCSASTSRRSRPNCDAAAARCLGLTGVKPLLAALVCLPGPRRARPGLVHRHAVDAAGRRARRRRHPRRLRRRRRRSVTLHLPPGLVGNPNAARRCPEAQFQSLAGCPASARSARRSAHGPRLPRPGTVYNLDPTPASRRGSASRSLGLVKNEASVTLRPDGGLDSTIARWRPAALGAERRST